MNAGPVTRSPAPQQLALREEVGFMALRYIQRGLSVSEAGAALLGACACIIATLPEPSRSEIGKMYGDALPLHVAKRAEDMQKEAKK